ncbi:MAG: hypothetical protein ACXACY_10300 [Candidatus Hodarchaeales archaeon]|jgi:hypothetical protein
MVILEKNQVGIPKKPGRPKLENKKIGIKTYFRPEFIKELERVNDILDKTQPQRKLLIFKRLIPYPYSSGDELQERYYEFEIAINLLYEVISKLPVEIQDLYRERIPKTNFQKILEQFFNPGSTDPK